MKIKKSDLLNMIQEQNDVIAKLIRQVNCHHEDIIRLEGVVEPGLQLKQLDQSVFDGLDEKWQFAAVDEDGALFRFAERPDLTDDYWANVNCSRLDRVSVAGVYDASNWQNSLIERDTAKDSAEVDLSSELTGNDLCIAMLARGDTRVMCEVYDDHNRNYLTHVIREYYDEKFHTQTNRWSHAIPISSRGKPLTQAEAGL